MKQNSHASHHEYLISLYCDNIYHRRRRHCHHHNLLETRLWTQHFKKQELNNNNNNNNNNYYYFSCHRPILPGNSLEPTAIPTVQASSFTLQYFPYYV